MSKVLWNQNMVKVTKNKNWFGFETIQIQSGLKYSQNILDYNVNSMYIQKIYSWIIRLF